MPTARSFKIEPHEPIICKIRNYFGDGLISGQVEASAAASYRSRKSRLDTVIKGELDSLHAGVGVGERCGGLKPGWLQ